VSAALVVQHAAPMRHIGIWACLPLPSFPPILSQKRKLFGGKQVIEHEMCSDFLYKFFLKHFSFKEEFNAILS
jgi:hypothetical protein